MSERRCFGCMRTTSQHYCEHCGWPADRQNESHQLPVGTVLMGKYQIGRVLGQGGFGITYLGWDMNLDIQVCIKEFYPSSTVNRDVTRSTVVNCNTTNMEGYYAACLERFLREGKALAKFRNVPQIVGIHDFFQVNNTAYMVMEFVSGIDLAKYVQKRGGRLHMDEILKILRPVMEALQLVHDAGIIHRDISPDNIMLEPREGAKLLDFGAVRNVEHPDAEKELTRATEAILKNGFAPMEQYVAKGSLGPWTDVYAMSATIYYCLTGRIPEDSPIRLMEGTPLDWTGAQGLTEHQKAVLEKGMEPRAKDRISSIRELMEKLYVVEEAPAPVPAPQTKKDPLKTDIISEFKVVMPPEPQKQPEKQPEPSPSPVVAEPAPPQPESQKQPERVILPASRKVEEPAQPQQPEKKPKPTWIIAVAAVLVLAILAGVFLIPKKETDTPQVSHQQVTTNPAEQTTEPPAWLSEPWAANVMAKDPFTAMGIDRATVTNVTFLDSTATAPAGAANVSAGHGGAVLGWMNGTDAYFAADGGINGERCCEKLFEECTELLTVTFGGAFHTDGATSMNRMFYHCNNLQTVDVEHLNTSNVTDMSYMFYFEYVYTDGTNEYCLPGQEENGSLTRLDTSGWDTSNVINMQGMFSGCDRLIEVYTGDWDVSNVVDMGEMFSSCLSLTQLDVGSWDTGNVQDMTLMFWSDWKLEDIDVSGWDTANVVSMTGMFMYCSELKMLDASGWDTSKVEDMTLMFAAASIEGLDVSRWNVSNVRSISSMFCGCSGWSDTEVMELDLTKWDTSNVVDMSDMFTDAKSGLKVSLGDWEVDSARNFSGFMDAGKTVDGKPWESLFCQGIPGSAVSCTEDGVTHYYFMYIVYDWDLKMSWSDAEKFCNARGGHLATLTSELQNETAFSAIDPNDYYTSVYFGLTDEWNQLNWRWVTGEPFGYAKWHEGEPSDNAGFEEYGSFYPGFGDNSWNDGDFKSENTKMFICEWDVPQ